LLNQTINYIVPAKPQLSLYFVMFSDDILMGFPPDGLGTGYLNVTNEPAWNRVIQNGVLNHSNAISQLYDKGARAIMAQGEIDASAFPAALASFGTNIAGLKTLSEYCRRYDNGFSNAVNAFVQTKPESLRACGVNRVSFFGVSMCKACPNT